jgi:hypothetical protein
MIPSLLRLRVALSLSALLGVSAPALAASPVPKTSFKNQKLPPCDGEYEREIHGACWMVVEAIPGDSLESMPETCAKWTTFELNPGDCLKKMQMVVPIYNDKPIPQS